MTRKQYYRAKRAMERLFRSTTRTDRETAAELIEEGVRPNYLMKAHDDGGFSLRRALEWVLLDRKLTEYEVQHGLR